MMDINNTPLSKESWYRDRLAEKTGGKTEVRTPAGNIDVLTESEIIEVKTARQWKVALGQVIAYGHFYPDLGKRIHFIGEPSDIAVKVCQSVGVVLTWEDPVPDSTYLADLTARIAASTPEILCPPRIRLALAEFNKKQKLIGSGLTLKLSKSTYRMSVSGGFPIRGDRPDSRKIRVMTLVVSGVFAENYRAAEILFSDLANELRDGSYRWMNWTEKANHQRMAAIIRSLTSPNSSERVFADS